MTWDRNPGVLIEGKEMDEIVDDFLSDPPDEDYECHVCGEEIPTERGVQPVEGEAYAVIRRNERSEPYAFKERYVHRCCLAEYLEQWDRG